MQEVLQVRDGVLPEVEDRRGQRGVGAAGGEDLREVLETAGAPGGTRTSQAAPATRAT